MKQTPAFLTLDHVSIQFGGVAALSDVTLRIERGEFVSFLGPSGCGKTTTLRAIAGFIRPDEGEISIEGRVLSSPTEFVPPEKRNLGMVFQSYAVWPHMTVRQNIELPLRARNLGGDKIRQWSTEAVRLCHLEGFEDREPHQLSGGQLQRVALARALAYRPQLILLDEPLSNLDIALREQLRMEIHRLHQATGATFILVTHDQVEAMSLSDRIVVVNEGRIEQVGTPDEIYKNPKTNFVASFVGSTNLLVGVLRAVHNTGGSDESWDVELGTHVFVVFGRGKAKVGDSVTLAIHPESIRLTRSGDAVGDEKTVGAIIPAVVAHTYSLGRLREFVVIAGGIELRVAQIRSGDSPNIGDQVRVVIAKDAIVAIEERAK